MNAKVIAILMVFIGSCGAVTGVLYWPVTARYGDGPSRERDRLPPRHPPVSLFFCWEFLGGCYPPQVKPREFQLTGRMGVSFLVGGRVDDGSQLALEVFVQGLADVVGFVAGPGAGEYGESVELGVGEADVGDVGFGGGGVGHWVGVLRAINR